MAKLIYYIVASVVIISCGSKKEAKEAFIPYNIFVQNDLMALDTMPLMITETTYDTSGSAVDTVVLTKAQFKEVAKQFTEPYIGDKKHQELYKEDKYADEATNTFNYTYTTKDTSVLIKSLTASTTMNESSKFKALLITKQGKDSNFSEQLFWESGKYCIIKTMDIKSGAIITKKYTWGI